MSGSRNKTSNADLAAMPGLRIKGNASAGSATPTDLTPEEAGQIIASQSGDPSLYLDGEGNFTDPGGGGGTPPDEVSIVTVSATLKRAALTGDVTAAQGSNATAIGANKVLDTMLRDSGALSVIGRSANSSGDPADISTSNGSAAVLRESGGTLGFGTVATAGIANDAVDDTKLRNSSALSVIGRSANSSGDPADISTTSGSGAVLRESGGTLGFGTIASAGIANDSITDAKLRNSAALSVIGRATNSSGDPADIVSAADGDVLIRVGTTLGFAAYRDVQSFLTAGTFSGGSGWVKPTGFSPKFAMSVVFGSGGGGGGGSVGSTAGAHQGGGGGGGGAVGIMIHLASDLGTNETVIVGAAGSSGTAGPAGGGAGGAGGAGNPSSYGTKVINQAFGGGGGGAGVNASNFVAGGGGGGRGGGGAVGTTSVGSGKGGDPRPAVSGWLGGISGGGGDAGESTSSTTVFGNPAEWGGGGGGSHNTGGSTVGPGGTSLYAGGGGGSGGSFTNTPAANAPTDGGSSNVYDANGGGEGNAGTSGASPTAGTVGSTGNMHKGGGGGGGGGAALNNNSDGKNGGDGGQPGGGGGGGGSGNGTGTNVGGAGGLGGVGGVWVISW